jgi:glycosyltransferase involved in cell wall biosynthesis
MNIGVDIRSLMAKNRTGVGEYTLESLNAIFKLDKKNQYFLFYNSYKDLDKFIPQWEEPNVHYVSTRYSNKILNLALTTKILRLNRLLPDRIDYWYSPNINFLCLDKNVKHIITIHDLSFKIFPEFYTYKQRLWHLFTNPKKQCRQAALIIVPSENTKQDLIQHYQINEEKIKVIYPGISKKCSQIPSAQNKIIVQKKYNLPENFILFLGSIEPRKNILGLIEAFEKLPAHLTDKYPLLIAGASGWKNHSIYEKAIKSKLKNQIKFLGYISKSDKSSLYSLAKLFIFPSFYEGFGFPVIEAMKIGTAVITSNRSSLPEICESSAYLIDPNNSYSLMLGIKNILENKTLREEYLKRGLMQASKYSWNDYAKNWLENLVLSQVTDNQIDEIS